MDKLPKVLATSVIRASNKGESHGGLYLIDLDVPDFVQIIDWDKIDINWEGRGLDRGMRGIARNQNRIYAAISDEILVFDMNFEKQKSIRNPYLSHCHEIYCSDNTLFLTSTGYDSILEYDILKERFSKGYCIRYPKAKQYLQKLNLKFNLAPYFPRLLPTLHIFDPNSDTGPPLGDSLHINNVHIEDGTIFLSGRRFGSLLQIKNNKLSSFSPIPYYTHNARPYRDGILANHTHQDKIVYVDRSNVERESYTIPHYDEMLLHNKELPDNFARQGFGRGLCCYKDLIIAGSSPATVSVYRRGFPDPIRSVNLTMDVRNAIHGLEVIDGVNMRIALRN